ncbi:MAG TPA: hypothetical protein VEC11_05080 [Allosphingosinicella sp.]|nr:hypothetical protein [Allosphingosinicella sp.]
MTSLLLLAFAQAAAQPAAPPLPRDWSTLPQLELGRRARAAPEDTAAIMDLARRQPECRTSVGPIGGEGSDMHGVRIDLAVLVNPDGSFRSIVARPGACDAIRNYARSVVNTRFRGQVTAPTGPGPAWYGTTLTFFGRP